MRPQATEKGLKFSIVSQAELPPWVLADTTRLKQILFNLINNAIKFTDHGSVTVTVVPRQRTDGNIGLAFLIKDTGIGLSQDDIHHLFGKFTRGSGGQKQNTEGSGLGLYVAKSMLEAQKGNIWVDSEGPGKGSTSSPERRSSSTRKGTRRFNRQRRISSRSACPEKPSSVTIFARTRTVSPWMRTSCAPSPTARC